MKNRKTSRSLRPPSLKLWWTKSVKLRGEKRKLDKLKIAVKSNWPNFDKITNLCLKLGMIAMDRWSIVLAETVPIPGSKQKKPED